MLMTRATATVFLKQVLGVFLALMLALFPPSLGLAQDVSFQSSVDRDTVELGSFLQLTLTVSGAKDLEPLTLPDLDGFTSRYLGPSTRISIVNGRYSSSVSYIYNLYPKRTGRLSIPAFKLNYEGTEYKTQPVAINVVDAASQTGSASGSGAGAVSLGEKIFIRLEAPRKTVYVNERIPVAVRLYVGGLSVRNIQYPEFDHTGFTVEDYEEPRRGTDLVNGIHYDVFEFRTHIYPTRPGTLTLGPARQVCDIISKSPSRRRSGRFDSLFDDDFFDSFFGGYDARPVTLETEPVSFEVLPLPQQGRPRDFSGGVGTFDFQMQVSPNRVKVGDPLTVRMRVSGRGNLQDVTMPSLAEQGLDEKRFKVYEPNVTLEADAKILEQVVVPKNEKIREFPAVKFSYFDTEAKNYRTITQGPFALDIEALSGDEQPRIIGGADHEPSGMPGVAEELGQDIVFIKNFPGTFQPKGFRLYRTIAFWLAFVVGVLVWAGLVVFHRFRHKIRTDERFARRLSAPRYAQKGLRQAREQMRHGRQKEFYDTVFKTLQRYLGNKFHIPPGAVTVTAVQESAGGRGIPEDCLRAVSDIFERCEMVRYASLDLDQQAMDECFSKTQQIIDRLERI